ncbi:MAG: hypothetical protein IBX55_13000 [Methyloprofundus sp.]|nr:hypothetical protein [Methyloprofundus sp.]
MQIGFVEQRQMVIGKDQSGNDEIAKWLEVIIRAPGVREMAFKMSKGKQEVGKKMPDWVLWYRTNQRKGEKYRDIQAGALWMSKSIDGQTDYLSGYIESPSIPGGRMRIAMFKAKPRFDGEQVTWMYDVVWSADKPANEDQNDYAPQYGSPVANQAPAPQANTIAYSPANFDDDDVPF